MSNEQWWAAERKAAEFWRKIRDNQAGSQSSNGLNCGRAAAPIAQPRLARLPSQTGLSQ
jgi:hypothetical protein